MLCKRFLKQNNMEKYLKFFFLHLDDYLDCLLGVEVSFHKELLEFNKELKKENPEWKKNDLIRIEIESKTFLEYLRLNNIKFK